MSWYWEEEDLYQDEPPFRIQRELDDIGQGHVTKQWASLEKEERRRLCEDTASLNFSELKKYFKGGKSKKSAADKAPKPIKEEQVFTKGSMVESSRQAFTDKGYQLIADGKVGIVLLAGGQGTRLGTKLPKGCVDIKLPSKKTLFQIQAERIVSLQKLAAEATFGEGSEVRKPIVWYIMLSEFTREYTESYFEKNAYFGLQKDQIFFYTQGSLPCLSEEDGKILMASPSTVAKAPDGNGGIYRALRSSGCLEDMARSGIQAVDCYCVDNLLAHVADPFFLGFCFSKGADVGCRTVAKASADEKVGVFVRRGKGIGVVEYSELDEAEATATKPNGELLYNWSNICMQYYSRQFLEKVATKDLGYHVAVKDVKTEAGTVKGLKLEKFIFDAFPYAKKTCLLEVEREAEFAPVKNAFGADKDSPDTARALLMQLHRRWAEAAGATIEGSADEGLEISPLMSYAGENLEEWAGKTLKSGTMVQSGEPHVAILDDPSSPLIAPKAARTISQDSVGLSKLAATEEPGEASSSAAAAGEAAKTTSVSSGGNGKGGLGGLIQKGAALCVLLLVAGKLAKR